VTRLIRKSELHGQSGQVLDTYDATEGFKQALSRPDDLPGFDDLLNAVGANRANYLQANRQQKLIEAVSSGDWVMVKSRIAADNGGASWNAFKPKPVPLLAVRNHAQRCVTPRVPLAQSPSR